MCISSALPPVSRDQRRNELVNWSSQKKLCTVKSPVKIPASGTLSLMSNHSRTTAFDSVRGKNMPSISEPKLERRICSEFLESTARISSDARADSESDL